MRGLFIVAIVLSLGLQPSYESSLGHQPLPPVVGMSGGSTAAEASPVDDPSLVKYAITQGGLAIVLLIVFWAYRRDLARIELRDQEKLQVVVALVEKNTAAHAEVKTAIVVAEQTSARLARAIEANRLIPPGAGA